MTRNLLNLLLLMTCLAGAALALPDEKSYGQHQGLFVAPDTEHVYQKIPRIEQELYRHTYWNQSYSERIARLERTLFGGAQRGAQEDRVQKLLAKMQEKSNADFHQNQEPMLVYLEEKLFQRTFDNRPLPVRVQQLESHVFGKTFESYPLEVRLKKLAYAIPIVAKEVRVAKDGVVIASTARKTPKTAPRTMAPVPEMSLIDASSNSPVVTSPTPLSTGDYFQAIHKQPNGQMVRWAALPIRIYVKPADAKLNTVANQAISIWQQSFSVEPTTSISQADVVIDWETSPPTDGALTRPFVHMGEGRKIRTIILISLKPFRGLSASSQLNATLHQMGHAFGLWGHSDDPHDIMYPSQKTTIKDIPEKWARRSATSVLRVSRDQPGNFYMLQVKPSQRDINTLLKIYDEPAQDLSTYNPYL